MEVETLAAAARNSAESRKRNETLEHKALPAFVLLRQAFG